MRQSFADPASRTESSSWLREQRHRVINVLLWMIVVAGPSGILPDVIALFRGQELNLTLPAYLIAYGVAVLLLVVRKIGDAWRALVLLLAFYAFAVFALYVGWLSSGGRMFLLAVIVLSALLLDIRAGMVAAALSLLTYAAFAVGFNQGVLTLGSSPDPTSLDEILEEGAGFVMSVGLMALAIWFFNQALVIAARANRAAEQARAALGERAAELEAANARLDRRMEALTATAEIAYDVTSVLDVQQLLDRLVGLIGERFGFYYAGVFLVDSARQWAVLQAAAGEVGQRLLARNYRVPVGEETDAEQSLVREVFTQIGHRTQLLDERDAVDSDWPDTRAELALPLRVQGVVIGVLDVHRRAAEPFDLEDVAVLQTLADQAAVAVNTAQLVQRVEAAAETERRARGELTREAWQNLLRAQPDLGYLADRRGIFESPEVWEPEMEEASRTARVVVADHDRERLAMPLNVGGQVIGVLEGRRPGGWSDEEIALLETLVEQLGATVERARLYRETRRTAARERTIGEVTGRVRETLDLETMLRTAADEIRRALSLERLVVRLGAPQEEEQA
ncbi:MAG: GAF domain-containing protein [Anaerolineae bacterium]|nr:GAF domain-containing protein [Anaerolineae bacterium]